MNDTIGKKIAKRRKEAKLTQEQLAQKLYVTDGTISKWETNKSTPDYESLKELSKIFDVKINYFLEDTSLKGHIKKMIKNIFSFIIKNYRIIIFLIFTFFLFIYFLLTFNSFQMYELKLKDNSFEIETGYYIKSKSKIVLDLSNIVINNTDKDIINQTIKLYTFVNSEKTYFYESSDLDNILIKDFNGYEEFITSKIAKSIPNYLYIEIENIHEDNTVTNKSSKLIIKKIADSKWMFHRNKMIYEKETKKYTANLNKDKLGAILLKKQFEKIKDTNVYYKKMDNYTLYFDLDDNKMFYSFLEKNIKKDIIYAYNKNIINYTKSSIYYQKSSELIEERFIYKKGEEIIECYLGDCSDYKIIYNKAFSIYQNVIN